MNIFCIDIEADGLLDTITRIHCAVAISLDRKVVRRFEPHQMREFTEFLSTVDVWIGHNIISYDKPAVKKVLGHEYEGKLVDTLLMSRLQNPHRTAPFHAENKKEAMKVHGLYAWGVRVGIDKPEIERWDEYTPEILHRCEEDVKINLAVYDELRKEAEGQNWKAAHLMTFKLFENLAKQEEAGWLADRPYIEKCIGLLTHWIDRRDAILKEHLPFVYDIKEGKDKIADGGQRKWVREPFLKSGKYNKSVTCHYSPEELEGRLVGGPFSRIEWRRVDLGSSDEVKTWMLSQGWEPAEWNTNDDGEITSPKMPKDGDFPGVEGKLGRVYSMRTRAAHRRSNLQGYLGRIREDGRIPSCVSGLTDTRRAKHKGIANVPNAEAFFGKQMRRCFIARPGWALVSADAAACQDRFMCERAHDDGFTKMLLEGRKEDKTDSHSLAQFAINQVTQAFRLHDISRGKAKNFNFGWTFGASDNKLGKMLNSNKEVGAEVRAALQKVFPAKAALIERITQEWRKNAKQRKNRWGKIEYYDGWVTGLDGSPVFIRLEHTVLVYAVQADEAIYMSAVYNTVHKYLEREFKWGEDYVVVCWYHDEVTVECRDEIKERVGDILESAFAAMTKYFKLNVPQIGEASIGYNWLEVH